WSGGATPALSADSVTQRAPSSRTFNRRIARSRCVIPFARSSGKCERAAGAEGEEGEAEPVALALARVALQRGQHHAIAGGDLAAGGEELPEPLLRLRRERPRAPLGVALHRAQARELGPLTRHVGARVLIRPALAGSEEGQLDLRRRRLDPVEPVVIHS